MNELRWWDGSRSGSSTKLAPSAISFSGEITDGEELFAGLTTNNAREVNGRCDEAIATALPAVSRDGPPPERAGVDRGRANS
jgi:hypothetical protein